MKWEVAARENGSGDWVVEGINFSGDGEIYVTLFSGPDSEKRAKDYLAFVSQ